MTRAADRRLIAFLAVSAVLHLLALSLPRLSPPVDRDATGPLAVRLLPSQLEKSVVVARRAARTAAPATASSPAFVGQSAPAPETAAPKIDIDAAFATARSHGRETQARVAPDAPQPQLTVEAAIARATRPDALIETRGAAGEYVTISGKTRCVTPLLVPHFLEGKTMLTQCETRKG